MIFLRSSEFNAWLTYLNSFSLSNATALKLLDSILALESFPWTELFRASLTDTRKLGCAPTSSLLSGGRTSTSSFDPTVFPVLGVKFRSTCLSLGADFPEVGADFPEVLELSIFGVWMNPPAADLEPVLCGGMSNISSWSSYMAATVWARLLLETYICYWGCLLFNHFSSVYKFQSANAIQMVWATWTIWAVIQKYSLSIQYDLAWRDPLPHDCFALLLSDYAKILRKFINSLRSDFAIISLNPIAFFSRFFKQTVGSYVCNIVLHPLLMAYVVEIGDNYADLSRKVLLPMYNAHHEFGPIPSKNRYMAQ